MSTATLSIARRTGGYVMSADDCWSFHTAACRADGGGRLTLSAEGDDCAFDLPGVLGAGPTGDVADVLGAEQPFDPADLDTAALETAGLVVEGRCLRVLGVRGTFTEFDPVRGVLCAELTVTAESDDGTFRDEFELWLACAYREEAGAAREAA